MPAQGERTALATRLVVLYYLATPAFALLDFRAGLDLRAAFLHGHPAARVLYYTTLFALGILASQRVSLAPLVGLLESGISIGLLAVSVFAAYVGVVTSVGDGEVLNPFTTAAVGNLCLSALALTMSYLSVRARAPGRLWLGESL